MGCKYKEIFEHYRTQMEGGSLSPGTEMPSEEEMAKQFSSSRDTVRKALMLLEQQHYIGKQRGKKSVVLDRSRYEYPAARITTFTEQLRQSARSEECVTSIADLSILIGDENAMQQLEVGEEDEVYRLIRVRQFGNERVILDKDLLLRSVVPRLSKKICSGSLYEYLEQVLKLHIGVAHKIITVENATREDKLYLDLRGDTVVAVVRSYTRLTDRTLFQYTETRSRIDYFRYEEDARR